MISEEPTKTPFEETISGGRLILRSLRAADVNEAYLSWMTDVPTMQYMESRFFSHTIESLREYVTQMANDRNILFLAIKTAADGKHIGNIKVSSIDWQHRFGDVGIVVGDKAARGKGYASEAIRMLCDYSRDILRFHKLTAGCYAPNVASRKAFEKAGFEVEGVRASQYRFEGRWTDALMMGRILHS